MSVNSKSIESYKELHKNNEISKRQLEVLYCIKKLGQATNRMLAKHLSWDINRVTGRVTELRDKNLVEYAGEYKDKETNRTVNLWKCN
jgi:DNA-binding MarR family transcriptional regulator